jgi:CheY-like chemotaxis protein
MPCPENTNTSEGVSVDTSSRSLDVLLVEDNPNTVATLTKVLRNWDYKVRVATDGPSALEAVRQQLPDVVLMDIGLPQMNGWEVASRIRSEFGNGPLLIALTAHCAAEDVECSRLAGFHLHLAKPTDLLQLQKILEHKSVTHARGTFNRD